MNLKSIPLGTIPYEKGYLAGTAYYAAHRNGFRRENAICVVPQEFVGNRNEDEYSVGFFAGVNAMIEKENM